MKTKVYEHGDFYSFFSSLLAIENLQERFFCKNFKFYFLAKFRQKNNTGSRNWICDWIGSKTSSQIIFLSWHNESLESYENLFFIALYQKVIGYKGELNPSSAWLAPSTAEDPAC